MAKVTYYYKSGCIQVKEIPAEITKAYGVKCDGTRPTKIVVEGEITDEFVQCLCYAVHPVNGTIYRNGEKVNCL